MQWLCSLWSFRRLTSGLWYCTVPCVVLHHALRGVAPWPAWCCTMPCVLLHHALHGVAPCPAWCFTVPCMVLHRALRGVAPCPTWCCSAGLRCTPLTVEVYPRKDIEADLTDDGFIPHLIRIDEGNTVKWSWWECHGPQHVSELKFNHASGLMVHKQEESR